MMIISFIYFLSLFKIIFSYCDFEENFETPQKIDFENSDEENIYHPMKIFFEKETFNLNKDKILFLEIIDILSKLLNNLIIVKNNKKIILKESQIDNLCNIKISNISIKSINNNNFDKLIFFNFEEINKPLKSKICIINSEDKRPIISLITINSKYNFSKNSLDKNIQLFLHQIIHLLYFSKTFFLPEIINGYINSIEMKKITFKHILKHSKFGALLQEQNNFHWNDFLNSNDLMNVNENNFDLSEFTIQQLESSSFYFINRCNILKYQNKCFLFHQKCLSHYLNITSFLFYGFDIKKKAFICYLNNVNQKNNFQCSNIFSELVFNKLDFSVNFDFNTYHYLDLYETRENENQKEQKLTLLIPSEKCLKKQRTVFFTLGNNSNINNKYNLENITLTNNKFFINYYFYLNPNFAFENTKRPFILNNIIQTNYYTSSNLNMDVIKYEDFIKRIKSLGKYNFFDHFPFYKDLTDKDNLFRLYKRMMTEFPYDYNFMRETYIIPDDKKYIDSVSNKYILNKNNLWLYKPNNKDKGKGIKILSNFKKISNKKAIITKYISNPFLINGKKFDIRLYVLITSFNPLKIYLNKEGLIRIASEQFSLSLSQLNNPFIHLTNLAINEKNKNFIKNDLNSFEANDWSFSLFKQYLKNHNINFEKIYEKIKDIIIKSFLLNEQFYINQFEKLELIDKKIFQLFGFDIMLDNNLKPYLIEINGRIPNLVSRDNVDDEIKNNLIVQILNLIGIIPFSHDVNEIPLDYIDYNFNLTDDIIQNSICEFERAKDDLERIFPLKKNIDYYKKFIKNPGKYNLALWEKLNDYE